MLYLSCPIGTVLVVKIVTKIPYLGFNFLTTELPLHLV